MDNTTVDMNNPFVKKHEAFHAMLNVTMQDAKEATKEDPAMPALMHVLLAAFEKHVDMLVETRFAALVESHKTLALMDDGMKTAISLMIDEAIENHEADSEHKTDEDIETEVSNHVEYFLRQGDHQFITECELGEKVSDALDEVLEDRVRDLLSNATVSIDI